MDINDIEKHLNEYPSDVPKVLNCILNAVAINQALLETLIDTQLLLLEHISPGYDTETVAKQIADATQEHLAKIQADITAKLL